MKGSTSRGTTAMQGSEPVEAPVNKYVQYKLYFKAVMPRGQTNEV